jgi:hypothetical protein
LWWLCHLVCCGSWLGWFSVRKNQKKLQPFRFAVFFQSDLVLRDIVVALPSGVLWMLAWLVFGSKESKKNSNLSALQCFSRAIWYCAILWWLCHRVW